jgi:ribose transport system ATP-binding protein
MNATVPFLEFDGIDKSFFGVRVLRDVSFAVPQGRVLGLIGENGAGKSTLMNILGGVLPADGGRMRLDGAEYAPRNPREATRRGVAFIHQDLNLFSNLSIVENMFITGFPRWAGVLINRRAARQQAHRLLAAVDLKLSPDMLVERLAPGERQLVETAKALHAAARVFIFDEPTTSLTARETERLFGLIERLRAGGASVIYISHILGDVRRLCDEIVILRDGEVVGAGPTNDFSIERMIALMVGRSIEHLYPPRSVTPTEEVALDVRDLSQRGIVADVRLTLHRGEVLGLFGLMGSGRTELARILFGLDPCERGEILMDGVPVQHLPLRERIRRGMAFVTENRREEGLLMDSVIAENIGLTALPSFARPPLHLIDQPRLHAAATRIAQTLRIKSGAIAREPAKSLSGGNQQKVVLGKWLLAKPSVFILDEPTRGIDVGARYEVYTIINDLAAQGAGVLMISSDLEELIGVCDRILVMSNGEIQGAFTHDIFDRAQILRTAFREHTPHDNALQLTQSRKG